jgi:hypothetical protein
MGECLLMLRASGLLQCVRKLVSQEGPACNYEV